MVEPWKLTTDVPRFIERCTTSLDASAFHKSAGVLVHNDATIERGAIIKPPAIISAACFLASTAYLRGGVYRDRGVTFATACEVKSPMVLDSLPLARHCVVEDCP